MLVFDSSKYLGHNSRVLFHQFLSRYTHVRVNIPTVIPNHNFQDDLVGLRVSIFWQPDSEWFDGTSRLGNLAYLISTMFDHPTVFEFDEPNRSTLGTITALVATTPNSSTDPGSKPAEWHVEKRYGEPGIVPPHHTPPSQRQPILRNPSHSTLTISPHTTQVVRYDDDEEETVSRRYLTTSTFVKIYGADDQSGDPALEADEHEEDEEEEEEDAGEDAEEQVAGEKGANEDAGGYDEWERGTKLLGLDLTRAANAVSNPGPASVNRPEGGITCKVCGESEVRVWQGQG